MPPGDDRDVIMFIDAESEPLILPRPDLEGLGPTRNQMPEVPWPTRLIAHDEPIIELGFEPDRGTASETIDERCGRNVHSSGKLLFPSLAKIEVECQGRF